MSLILMTPERHEVVAAERTNFKLPEFSLMIEVEKMTGMRQFDNRLSMIELSMNAPKMQDQYMNFYQKGPLVGLCLEISLRELSRRKMGTQDLMLKLMNKYGPDEYFKDEVFQRTIPLSEKPCRALSCWGRYELK